MSCGCHGDPRPSNPGDRALRQAPRSGDVVNRPRPIGGGCCSNRDLGPLEIDEDPSQDDIERFGDVTRTCPECKTEVYDEAALCWKCGHAFAAGGTKKMPVWAIVVVALMIAAFAGVFMLR